MPQPIIAADFIRAFQQRLSRPLVWPLEDREFSAIEKAIKRYNEAASYWRKASYYKRVYDRVSHVLNIIDEFVVQPRLQVDIRAVLAG